MQFFGSCVINPKVIQGALNLCTFEKNKSVRQEVGYNYAKALFSTWVKKDLVKELFLEEQAGKLPDTKSLNVIMFDLNLLR